jgi:hypothetical protein
LSQKQLESLIRLINITFDPNSSYLIHLNPERVMNEIYLTTDELSQRIKYDARTIRNCLKDSVLLEGIHYFRPFGGRKILFIWEAVERDMVKFSRENGFGIPMANGGICRG